jgi:hypothetical protein
MRIPIEAPGLYRVGGEHRMPLESTRTGPVANAAGLRPALSEHFTEAQRHEEEKTMEAPRHEVNFHAEERRKQERRREQRPALLDTRLKQRRQEAARSLVVNFDI